ncbi:MAG: 4-hydroxy-tetrahydrodipicolinate synthase, partial [Clostridia bacterium]|nr:4-hydroxy-tetrahydrodipicolinate synthase [Clostridia bacterium]
MIFEGSGVALITPFNSTKKVDFFTLKKLIDFQISNGTNAIIILGTTGESSTITYYEREEIIRFCVKVTNKIVPVIVGCGSNSTDKAISFVKQAKRLGADASLIVTPYYNKCNQDGLYLHYKNIAEMINLPMILYNVPSRTGVNLEPETVLKLSKISNIVGI